jgi:hypothetical protein
MKTVSDTTVSRPYLWPLSLMCLLLILSLMGLELVLGLISLAVKTSLLRVVKLVVPKPLITPAPALGASLDEMDLYGISNESRTPTATPSPRG